MKLKWTKHGVVRGYSRLGRYGLPEIEKKILASIDTAVAGTDGKALVRFKLGRKRCVAVLQPLTTDGTEALVITTFEDGVRSSHDYHVGKRLGKHDKKPRKNTRNQNNY